MVIFDKDKAYMEVLSAFRLLLSTEYKNGGWLPPSREMSRKLNVNPITYRKATNRLIAENVAESFPRKGIYIIPEKYRPKKVGLVIGRGEESPFLFHHGIVQEILQVLDDKQYSCHILQGNSGTNVARNAMSHCVDGVIWLIPHVPDYRGIVDIWPNKLFPLVCVQYSWPPRKEDVVPAGIPYVSEDYSAIGSKLAEPFIIRRHRKVAWVGASFFLAEYIGLGAVLRDTGLSFDENNCVADHIHRPGEVTKLVTERGVTGIIIPDGAARHIESAFEELSALPEELLPEVLVWNCPTLPKICAKFPQIGVIGIAQDYKQKFGKSAVDMLLNNLDTPEDIRSVKVKAFQVSRTEKFFDTNHVASWMRKSKMTSKKVRGGSLV